MQTETKYTRKSHTIKNLETEKLEHFKSISKAKKASHELQMKADGVLGKGTVRVIARKQTYKPRKIQDKINLLTMMPDGSAKKLPKGLHEITKKDLCQLADALLIDVMSNVGKPIK